MKELFGLVSNVRGGVKTTVTGIVFICLFTYNYFTSVVPLELVSVDVALLGLGVSLLFANGPKNKKEEKEEKKPE